MGISMSKSRIKMWEEKCMENGRSVCDPIPHQESNMVEAVLWHGHVWLSVAQAGDINDEMNPEAYRTILGSHIQQRSTKLSFTVQKDNDCKHTMKATQDSLRAKKRTVPQLPSRWPNLNSTVLFDNWRQRWIHKSPQTSNNWRWLQWRSKHLLGENLEFGDLHLLQTEFLASQLHKYSWAPEHEGSFL